MSFTRDELRPLDILEGLPDEQLDWLREHEVPPVAVPLPMLDPEPSVVPGVGAS